MALTLTGKTAEHCVESALMSILPRDVVIIDPQPRPSDIAHIITNTMIQPSGSHVCTMHPTVVSHFPHGAVHRSNTGQFGGSAGPEWRSWKSGYYILDYLLSIRNAARSEDLSFPVSVDVIYRPVVMTKYRRQMIGNPIWHNSAESAYMVYAMQSWRPCC